MGPRQKTEERIRFLANHDALTGLPSLRLDQDRLGNALARAEREQGVLVLLAQGKRNKEISRSLFISERTVKFHVSALMQKLGASNRTEAVKTAIDQGLVGS